MNSDIIKKLASINEIQLKILKKIAGVTYIDTSDPNWDKPKVPNDVKREFKTVMSQITKKTLNFRKEHSHILGTPMSNWDMKTTKAYNSMYAYIVPRANFILNKFDEVKDIIRSSNEDIFDNLLFHVNLAQEIIEKSNPHSDSFNPSLSNRCNIMQAEPSLEEIVYHIVK